jgi:hypothetical protein
MSAIGPARDVVDHEKFVRQLSELFPHIAAEFDDTERGLLHLEMAAFARATNSAIAAEDWPQALSHYAFIDEVFARADSAVENAVYVSYLENVFLWEDNPRHLKARTLLPERLQTALQELEEHFRKLEDAAKGT